MASQNDTSNFEWFDKARFGMFIHWGVYAMPARGEWVKTWEKMTELEYDKYVQLFDPDLFNPADWAKTAKAAGMKYLVITAKHHDGFCIWDTKHTDYNSVKASNCGRDLLDEIINAFRAEGLNIGVYYSLPDWHHLDCIINARHPLRDTEAKSAEYPERYAEFIRNQVAEILTNYGKIDLMWFDGAYPETKKYFECEKLRKHIAALSPDTLVNRLPDLSDFASPEQAIPEDGIRDEVGQLLQWEGCQVFSGTWGYARDNQLWKSPKEVVEMLIKHTARGGNMLLNVGPTSRGTFCKKTQRLLDEVADWMKYHNRAVHGCTIAPKEFPEPKDGYYTWNAEKRRLYLHLTTWPDRRIFLKNLISRFRYAQLMCDGSEILTKEYHPGNIHGIDANAGELMLSLPVERPDTLLPVIEIFLED